MCICYVIFTSYKPFQCYQVYVTTQNMQNIMLFFERNNSECVGEKWVKNYIFFTLHIFYT